MGLRSLLKKLYSRLSSLSMVPLLETEAGEYKFAQHFAVANAHYDGLTCTPGDHYVGLTCGPGDHHGLPSVQVLVLYPAVQLCQVSKIYKL